METKEDVIVKLLENPKYSSGWIQSALPMITEHGWDEDKCYEYNAEQLSTILSAFNEGAKNSYFEPEIICNPKMNQTQMQIILKARTKGISVSFLQPYLNTDIPYTVINWLLEPMIEKGIDLTEYLEWVNNDQAFEIKDGAMNGIDYTQYAYPEISGEKMGLIKHCMLIGLDYTYDRETGVLTVK